MKRTIRSIGLGTVILIFSMPFSSCEKKQESVKDELVIGVSQDYRATDVFSHKGFNCLVFETLVKADSNGKIRPLIAESWEKSPDGKHYTFHLGKDVVFSDGTPLTARHVEEAMFFKASRKRKRGPGRFRGSGKGSPAGKGPPATSGNGGGERNRNYGTFDNERYNLPRWTSFSNIDVIDEHTIRFYLPRPYTLFLTELATTHGYPVIKPDDSEEVTGYIGTGPYKIDVHKRTQYMMLVKNENYWRGSASIEKIRLKVIPDAETRAIALEAGEIDLTGYDHFDKIPNESVTRLKDLTSVTVKTFRSLEQPSISFMAVNYKKEPFDNPDVRKAFGMAIERKQIDAVISETGKVIGGPFPKGHELYNPEIEKPEFNSNRARKLLSDAGWSDNDGDGILDKNGKPFSVTLTFSGFDPQYKIIAEIIQAQFRNIGLEMTLNMVELGAHITAMRNAEYDLAFWPLMRYHMFLYTGHPSWLNVYSSPELDEFFTRYLHGNEDERRAVFETQKLIMESHVFPLFIERFDVVAWNHDTLRDFSPLPLGWDLAMDLWKTGLKQD